MKRKITSLFAAFVLLTSLIPMTGWGQTTYEQLTSISNIDESAQYVLGIDGTGFHYNGTSSWGLTALPSAQAPIYYTLTKATDGNSFTAQATISGTTYYLQIPTSNTFSMATSTGTNTDIIIGTTQVSGTNYAVANKTTTARHLRINGTSGLRSYAGTTGNMAFFYKVVSSGSTTSYTVTYDCNGGTSGCPEDLTDVEIGTEITLASAPTKTDYVFNGWNDGTDTYQAGASYTINSNVTFTAQWHLDVDYLFYESFNDNNGTGGNDNQWSGTIANNALQSDNEGWTFANGNGANQCAKFGTSSKLGSAQTPAITHTGNATLTFKAAAWNGNSESINLKLSATSGTLSASSVTLVKGEWTNYTIEISNISTSTQIKFEGNAASNSRFFLDEVMVVEAAPSTDPYISAEDVEIVYNATTGSIYFEIANFVEGNMVATTDEDWISGFTYDQVDEIGEVDFTTIENNSLSARTATITLTYTYGEGQTATAIVTVTQTGNPNAPGTEHNPYTVAQARAAIDANEGVTDVYATGIVSEIVTAYNSQYGNISYNISTDGLTTSDQLEAYRGKSYDGANFTSENDIQVGDSVVIFGNLTKYGDTYEFAQNNQLVSLVRPQSTEPSITLSSYSIEASAEGTDGTLTVTYENIAEVAAEVFFCNADGEAATYEWFDAEINNDNNVEYVIDANSGEARTAYFKVWAYDDDLNEVYSDLVTINQVALAIIDLRGVTTPLVFNAGEFTSSGSGYQDYDNVTYTGDNGMEYGGWTLRQVMKSSGNMQMKASSGKVYMPTILTDYGFTITVAAETNSVIVGIGEDSEENTYTTAATSADVVISTGTKYAVISTITITPCTPTTYTLDITGYDSSTGGYYLIASPVVEAVTPTADNGFLTEAYDLYYFDQSEVVEWRNYKAGQFNIENGTGYLYASQANTTLTFTGTPYSGNGEITLVKSGTNPSFDGWNLVGNPFSVTAYPNKAFYTMNGEGSEIVLAEGNSVESMEGVFVVAESDGEVLTFSTEAPAGRGSSLVMNLSHNTRGTVIDRVILNFDSERQLPKFQLRESSTKIYVPQADKDYALVSAESNMGELPVNFKAENDGSYTLSFSAENVSFNYLHLIDNMTGKEVDLLSTPYYSFGAQTTDYANRFKLVYATGESSEDNFVFYSNGSFVISNEGEATLQVMDVTGRIVKSESISGSANVDVNAAPGVYMFRLVNGNDVKTQKVVVK